LWPVALTKVLNCRFVSGVRSIQKQRHAMDRRFFRIMVVGAHLEGAAGDPDHAVGPAIFRWPIVRHDVGALQCHGVNSRRIRYRSAPLPQFHLRLNIASGRKVVRPTSSVNLKLIANPSKRNAQIGDDFTAPAFFPDPLTTHASCNSGLAG